MEDRVAKKLLDINDKFYQSFGPAFAETRRRLQPGVERILDVHLHKGNWLDLGCGSGVLGQRLAQSGFQGSYLGLDFSAPLLEEARKGAQAHAEVEECRLTYAQANLLEDAWVDQAAGQTFDGVLAFAALHHIPGAEKRRRLLEQVNDLLAPGGLFVHSEWQFQNSPKLMARVQSWSLVGLDERELEKGDTLLDWRHHTGGEKGEAGLRYVHLFDRGELAGLASGAGFEILEEFESDGKGGNLALYQVWRRNA